MLYSETEQLALPGRSVVAMSDVIHMRGR